MPPGRLWPVGKVCAFISEFATTPERAKLPADALVDGFLILLAGILLITPGVVTDLVGIAFLIPPIRTLVKRGVKAWIRRNVEVRVAGLNSRLPAVWRSPAAFGPDEIIDARVIGTRVEDANPSRY